MGRKRNVRGSMLYVPPVIIEEMDSIKDEEDIEVNTEALRKLANFARVGREVERMKGKRLF